MKKNISYLLFLLFILQACSTTKKVQPIQTAISKKDTTHVVTISEETAIDSVAIIKDVVNKVIQHKINFSTFFAKIKVDYESPSDSKKFTAYTYMQKDSVIYLRLVGNFLGITKEGVVAKITKDSITVVNKIDKIVQRRALNYLQEITAIPFDYYTIQDILIGNPIYIDSNIVSYRVSDDKLSILMLGNLFKHLISLDKNDYKVLHSKLDDVDFFKNRTCNITYSNYVAIAENIFSTQRKISVSEKSKLDIWLDFKQYVFNEPLTYVFNIPKNYKRQ
ncbi:MAG: DUF4292 domain-containing protein [Chitinophagaceae bacterium]|nr:DUF4292 domain-containing protein [Chitinophagaceae bacterium]MCW5904058.1 DUF4292 domain-containing protein [Chitinophagaceae bacterium]